MPHAANRQRDPMPPAAADPRPTRPAFTIVELIVVVAVIALLLGIAVPGLSSMTREARFSAAAQAVNGALTRAHFAALSDANMVALRFLPATWDAVDDDRTTNQRDRQHIVFYDYVGSNYDLNNPSQIVFSEHFKRREGASAIELPPGVWVAPLESMFEYSPNDASPLAGEIGQFELDAANADFVSADDFLIVFDPKIGVFGEMKPPDRTLWTLYTLRGTDFSDPRQRETDQIKRYSASGVVCYRRDDFLALGNDAEVSERLDWLRANGRPYLVHRFGGGLVMGNKEVE